MSDELGAAGAAVTAGLVAGAVEGREAHKGGTGPCANCGAELSGRYCANCGQAAHIHRTLAHMFEEFLHGIVHFDTKAWRTLPLLVARPGTLTHGYIHGKRARYISPLAMFLFSVFLMFVAFAYAPPQQSMSLDDPIAGLERASRESLDARLVEAREGVAEIEAELTALDPEQPGAGGTRTGLEFGRAGLERTRHAIETEIARREGSAPPPAPASAGGANEFLRIVGTPEAGDSELESKIREKLANPDLVVYKLQQNAYKFSFLLVPISLPFVALLFLWKRGHTLYDHTVFTLYSLSFMSLLFIVVTLAELSAWTAWAPLWLLGLGAPAHMFFQLKGTYALGWFSALWRTFFLLIFAGVSLVIFFVLIFLMGVLG